MSLISSLKDNCLDDILSIREDLGAALAPVMIVTRTWSGEQLGDGTFTEALEYVRPTPGIRDYSLDMRVTNGGTVQQGDILLQMISKNQYESREFLSCLNDDPLIEKFYRVGGKDYRVVSVIEKQLTWDVLLRRISDQSRRG